MDQDGCHHKGHAKFGDNHPQQTYLSIFSVSRSTTRCTPTTRKNIQHIHHATGLAPTTEGVQYLEYREQSDEARRHTNDADRTKDGDATTTTTIQSNHQRQPGRYPQGPSK